MDRSGELLSDLAQGISKVHGFANQSIPWRFKKLLKFLTNPWTQTLDRVTNLLPLSYQLKQRIQGGGQGTLQLTTVTINEEHYYCKQRTVINTQYSPFSWPFWSTGGGCCERYSLLHSLYHMRLQCDCHWSRSCVPLECCSNPDQSRQVRQTTTLIISEGNSYITGVWFTSVASTWLIGSVYSKKDLEEFRPGAV